jgi:hypothetical protein
LPSQILTIGSTLAIYKKLSQHEKSGRQICPYSTQVSD